jgi:hypothetical protein
MKTSLVPTSRANRISWDERHALARKLLDDAQHFVDELRVER